MAFINHAGKAVQSGLFHKPLVLHPHWVVF
jgi:hypothetical protein